MNAHRRARAARGSLIAFPDTARYKGPPRWKMALLTWCALLPQVIVLGAIVPDRVPPVLGAALTTAIPVALLTWVIMPRLTAWFDRWLHAHDAGDIK